VWTEGGTNPLPAFDASAPAARRRAAWSR